MLSTFEGAAITYLAGNYMININIDGVLSLPSVPHQHKEFLPEFSGLYFVIAHTPSPQLVYLGKAKNIAQRWKNHHRQPEINLLHKIELSVDIYWLELRVSDEILSQWENRLIKDLSPALNDTLTMTTEINRLEDKISVLEEFSLSTPSGVLPDLSRVPTSFDKRNRQRQDLNLLTFYSDTIPVADICPHCHSQNIKWLSQNAGRKQCKDCKKTWSIK